MVDGINNNNNTSREISMMDLWKQTLNENKTKNEERTGIMDRGQRTSKSETESKVGKFGQYECKTCASRKYQDQSDDSSVSFQAPTHVAAGQSAAAVTSHEREHVANENAKAKRENREVIQSSVSIHYAICPECGRTYAAGGETRTVTKAANKDEQTQDQGNQQQQDYDAGKKIDQKA
jgi:hypothetical protein